MEWLYALALGYLLGSVPFGLILTRAFGAGDLRCIGSGSIGATNVLRTGRKGLAAATVLLDAGKGVAAVLLASTLVAGQRRDGRIGAIAGHCFPVWLKFNGGKGFATAAGVLGALAWPVMLICAAVWAAALALSRISSVSSLARRWRHRWSHGSMGLPELVWVMAVIALIVVIQHRANIRRLLAGTEPKVGAKS